MEVTVPVPIHSPDRCALLRRSGRAQDVSAMWPTAVGFVVEELTTGVAENGEGV